MPEAYYSQVTYTFEDLIAIFGTNPPPASFNVAMAFEDISGQTGAALLEVVTNPVPAAPATLAATAGTAGQGTITLTWDRPTETDLKSIRIYRHTVDDSGASSEIAQVAWNADTYVDEAGGMKTYYYWVKAEDVFDQLSAYSTVDSATTGFTLRGWSHNIAFTATDHDTVAWAVGSIYLADQAAAAFTIDPGANTGNITEVTYIYLDSDTSTTALQTSTDSADAVGLNKILICVAEDVASGKKARFQVFGGDSQGVPLIVADNIAANTITANEIAANTITAAEIAAGTITATEITGNTLSAIYADMGMLTAGSITGAAASFGDNQEVKTNASGIQIELSTGYVDNRSYQFLDSSDVLIGQVRGSKAAPGVGADQGVQLWCSSATGYDCYASVRADSSQVVGDFARAGLVAVFGAESSQVYAHIASTDAGDQYAVATDHFRIGKGLRVGSIAGNTQDNNIRSEETITIGASSSGGITIGLTIDLATNTDNILEFKSKGSVAHGMTTLAETDTFGYVSKAAAADGGMSIVGARDTGTQALLLSGAAPTDDTTHSTAGTGYIELRGYKKNGTGTQDAAVDANLVVVRNRTTTHAIFDADGDLHLNAGISASSYDAYDDAIMVRTLRASLMPEGNPIREEFSNLIEEFKPIFDKSGLVTYNSDGQHFIAMKKWTMLLADTTWQLAQKLKDSERRIGALEQRLLTQP